MKLYYTWLLFFLLTLVMKITVQAQEKNGLSYIKVSGEVTKPLTLYEPDLEKMKQQSVNFKGRDPEEHSYTGVPVMEILNQAGVTMGKQLRGENLAKYLLVIAADGYQVLFSLAELDSSFMDKPVILANKKDGKPLAVDKGPFQLIVPGEKKPARSCFQVTAFVIRFAKD